MATPNLHTSPNLGAALIEAAHAANAAAGTASGTVNTTLTAKRRNRVVENHDYAAFVRRVLRAHSRRIGTGDIDALTDLVTLATDLDTAIRHAVTGLRDHGYSWTDIATRLGITRQGAQQRWGGDQP